MEKTDRPQKLRGSRTAKVFAFLLAVLLGAGACGGGAAAFCLFQDRTADPSYWSEMDSDAEILQAYLFYYLHEDALTENGQWEYRQLQEDYNRNSTNLRFRIRKNGITVLSNVSDTEFEDMAREYASSEMSVDGFVIGASRWLSYYLDLSKVTDWEIVHGTAETWANTAWVSEYYYNADGGELGGDNAPADAAADDETTGTDTATIDTATTAEAGSAETYETESEAYDGDTQYYYYRYTGDKNTMYTIQTTVAPEKTKILDVYWDIYQDSLTASQNYETFFRAMLILAGVCAALFLAVLVWLTRAIGWGADGTLALRGLNRVPAEFPVLALVGGGFAAVLMGASFLGLGGWRASALACGLLGAACALGGLTCWCILAAQIKTRRIFSNSLYGRLCRWLRSYGQKLAQWLRAALAQWPLYWKLLAVFAVYAVIQYAWSFWLSDNLFWGGVNLLSILLNMIPVIPLAAAACKWAVDFDRLRKGAQKLAQGDLNHKIDVESGRLKMLPDLKAHAQELNRISDGMSRAVEEQTKSQRFKTELITNVSHDLKTPLTSIINYVDLLKKLNLPDEKAREYLDVLDRKSQRLKTLTEDLVEASKAASGTIGVRLERLDLSQLAEQAAAEYQDRLELAGLTPVISKPEQPCMVLADGRHLWRVLDNLLGNCTKYAMPGTRVYLDVTCGGGKGTVTVKNISADPLNVPAEELLKRFVRGDSSRSTEGSGLGLSIARNLTAAQKGDFDLVVDGDLFKAVIALPLAEAPAETQPVPKPEPPAKTQPMPKPEAPAETQPASKTEAPAETQPVPQTEPQAAPEQAP